MTSVMYTVRWVSNKMSTPNRREVNNENELNNEAISQSYSLNFKLPSFSRLHINCPDHVAGKSVSDGTEVSVFL